MENKKQLIIIPPMSEALTKLNEVLNGISAEENMEITIIDDLKELSQFLGATGQCLILASNAKKCATFLQENKSLLNKFHCKTILFTPKEIPAKTLIKFTKVGLTESILESSPPKTFLYKVKLLLRSIKTIKPQDDAEKTVKSLEAMKVLQENFEKESKERISTEENTGNIDVSEKKRMSDSGDTIDYGGNLKGKNKHQEESIETNWKSEKKKDSFELAPAIEDDKNSPEAADNSIDMYYRGKQQKNIDLFGSDEVPSTKDRPTNSEEAELDIVKKKSTYADIVEEGSIRHKRLDNEDAEEESEEKKRVESIELNLEAAKRKAAEEIEERMSAELLYTESSEGSEDNEKKRNKQLDLNLDNSMRGKLRKDEISVQAADESEEGMTYDNSEIEKNRKKTDTQIELDAAEKSRAQESDEASAELEPTGEEVDNLNSNMIGKERSVDNIQTNMISKTKKSEELDVEHSEDNKSPNSQSSSVEEENSSRDTDNPLGLDFTEEDAMDEESTEGEKSKSENKKESSELDLNLEAADKKDKLQYESVQDDDKKRTGALFDEQLDNRNKNESTVKEDDKELNLRSLDNDNLIDAPSKNMTSNGQVDKIDTYYRSGDNKKNEHSWDNLTKKNDSLKLDLLKTNRGADTVEARAHKDLGEITIDYRKLKAEFDLISNGSALPSTFDKTSFSEGTGRNYDDAGSFKVIEVETRGLDFSIDVVNAILDKDVKPKKIFSMISLELVKNYKCLPVFYTYKLSDKKFTEVFNGILETGDETLMANDKKEWWLEYKKETALFEHFQSKSMTTWRCTEVVKDGAPWEDVELPSWAAQELINKRVELVFPYFDGIDRMGMAVIILPEGIDPKMAPGLLTVLEMARMLFLDTIERYQVKQTSTLVDESSPEVQEDKKGVLNFFGGLFGKKKAG